MSNYFINILGLRFYIEYNDNTAALSEDIFSRSGKEMMKKPMKMINCKYIILVPCKGLK